VRDGSAVVHRLGSETILRDNALSGLIPRAKIVSDLVKVYGIVNCNTVKAARAWLDKRKLGYEFVDFKKTPPTEELLARWCATFGWENVLNRRGTTWRLLPPAAQARVKDEKSAIALMREKPTVIKRPVVESGKTLLSGFDEAEYSKRL
jgi:Spx/MgsR family transcriptional regulator